MGKQIKTRAHERGRKRDNKKQTHPGRLMKSRWEPAFEEGDVFGHRVASTAWGTLTLA